MRAHSFWARWCLPYEALRTSVKAVTHKGAAVEGSCSPPAFPPRPSGDTAVSPPHLLSPPHPSVRRRFPPLQTLTSMLPACGKEMLPCLTMNSWPMYISLLVSQVWEVSHCGCVACRVLVVLKVLVFPRDLSVIIFLEWSSKFISVTKFSYSCLDSWLMLNTLYEIWEIDL